MNTQSIKTALLKIFGEKFTAYIHALRFIYLHKIAYNPDPEVVIASKILKEGDISVDVGANGGGWTLDLLDGAGKSGHVYAFEADPYYALATGVFFKFMGAKRVTLFDFGLSNKTESLALRVKESDGNRSTGGSFIDKDADLKDEGVAVVELKVLDSLVKDYPDLLRTAVIKCDVEGFELFVFQGAIETIEEARPFVILEVGHYEKQGYSNEILFDLFKQRGYQAFALIAERKLAPLGDDLQHPNAISVNRILAPSEKIDAIAEFIQPS